MSIPKNKPRVGRGIRRWFRHKVEPKPAGMPIENRIRDLERFILTAEERASRTPRPGYLPPVEDPGPRALRHGPMRSLERNQIAAERMRLWFGIGLLLAFAILLAAWLASRMKWV